MADDPTPATAGPLALEVKRFFMASRNLMEAMLRRHGLGQSQWMVLDLLAAHGPLPQSELVRRLDIERASLSGVVAALTSKGLVAQEPVAGDGRQKRVRLTEAGDRLWRALPDPVDLIEDVAFAHVGAAELAVVRRELGDATRRLQAYKEELR